MGIERCRDSASIRRESLQHSVQLLRVQTAQLADSGIIISILHEEGQRQLLCLRTGLRVFVFNLAENLRHALRQNHVGNLDRRKQSRRKCSQIDHAVVPIQTLQRRNRFSEITQLAVVIILDDDALVADRPVDQFISSADRHHRARRKLIGRADINR